ncbi:ImuA family protein [Sphingobacterium sp. LRF_L2]|uniref:ImuA family protein n=1 Tax=Sphingobacterium sp. LRF_L2 TaxID=3369421 RepID=UPI003F600991
MSLSLERASVVSKLQQHILQWQGLKKTAEQPSKPILGGLEKAFPTQVFPLGGIHEFVYQSNEERASTCGVIGGILSNILQQKGICLWISNSMQVFTPAISSFNFAADRIIFIYLKKQKDILWALEESLKCSAVQAVIAEVEHLNFIQSRRLQLATEKTGATGFVLRSTAIHLESTACIARWHIKPIASLITNELPGVGIPQWQVYLSKIKNGNPSRWELRWNKTHFLSKQVDPQSSKNERQIKQQQAS